MRFRTSVARSGTLLKSTKPHVAMRVISQTKLRALYAAVNPALTAILRNSCYLCLNKSIQACVIKPLPAIIKRGVLQYEQTSDKISTSNPDHYSNRNTIKSNSMTCLKISKQSHISSSCGFDSKPPYRCYNCGGIEHVARNFFSQKSP